MVETICSCAAHQQPRCAHFRMGTCKAKPAHQPEPRDDAVAWQATDDDLNKAHTLTADPAVAEIWRNAGMTVRPLYARRHS